MATPIGVHLVGSIPLPTSAEVFEKLGTTLPHHLRRIPDGEPGERGLFINWQGKVFALPDKSAAESYESYEAASVDISDMALPSTGYCDAALESYETFKELRSKGVIPPGVRFQVSLPTPLNVIAGHIKGAQQTEIERKYEKALFESTRRIQDAIPAADLAIQWDIALEFAMLEGIWPAWFSPVEEGVEQRILEVSSWVDDGVEMGYHLCYGDYGHKHFVEPKDMSRLVDVANKIIAGVKKGRKIDWIHMPVPKDRNDEAYFEALKGLKAGDETVLYLGLVHAGDEEGTKARIQTAKGVLGERIFGVGTECGMGRTPTAELDDILKISKDVSHPCNS